MWTLVRGPDGEAARDRVGRGEDTSSLHRHRMATRGANLGLHLDWRGRERRIDVAMNRFLADADVVLDRVIKLGCARLSRLIRIDDCFQRFVLDLDRGGRVGSLRLARGDHRGDRLTDVAHLAPRQWLDSRDGDRVVLLRLRDVLLWRLAWTFVGLDRVLVGEHGGEIASRHYGDDPRHGERFGRVDV